MIYVLSGGQTGATLTVTSSGAGTITVSNTSLGKSYSKSVTAGGSAVFKGLATGTWTVKLTDGSKTSTKTITITSDYSTSIAYFSATIKVTYPAKSKCVIKNSSGTQVASNTNTGTSAKTWTATVNATGTYTVTATATDGSGKSKSQSVRITANGQSVSVEVQYSLELWSWKDDGLQGLIDISIKSTGLSHRNDVYNSGTNCAKITSGVSGIQGILFPDVNVSNYSTLKVTGYGSGGFGISTDSSNISLNGSVAFSGSTLIERTLDISALSGYLCLYINSPETSLSIYVSKIYLE